MFILFPLLCFILLFLIFCKKSNEQGDWRESFLSAAVVWGVLVFVITELLGRFNSITFFGIVISWIFIDILLLILFFKIKGALSTTFPKPLLSFFSIILLCCTVFIVCIVAIIALKAPPTNWDSMTYHLGRVVHWIQNRNVDFYPTNIERQLWQPPLAEYAIMHFQILSNGDRFANLIQWFSMLGSIIGCTVIAKQLGGTIRSQIFAAVVCATIPMGILQGSSTQNDYVVAFWVICFIHLGLLLIKNQNRKNAIGAGSSLGLALLTKGTAYFYTFPFLVWVIISGFRKSQKKYFKYFLIIGIISLALNLPYYIRNFDLYKSPFGPGGEGPGYSLANNSFTPKGFLSNVIRNMGLHIGTPSKRVSAFMERGVYKLHKILGLDIKDPATTWPGTRFWVSILFPHEDSAANPLHFLLICVAFLIFLLKRELREDCIIRGYLISAICTFLLFCFYLKWQPWHSRIQLSIFVLFAPFIAVVLSRAFNQVVVFIIALGLIAASYNYVFNNYCRPLSSSHYGRTIFNTKRIEQYFVNKPDLMEAYKGATKFVATQKPSGVGLILWGDDWEYLYWVFLKKYNKQLPRIEHIDAKNESLIKTNRLDNFTPSVIIFQNSYHSKEYIIKHPEYILKWSQNPVEIYVRNK